MKWFYPICIGLLVLGCAPKKGDYVTYTSDEYIFIENSFINQSMDCMELGEMSQGGLRVKYCIGENYASQSVEGFVFEHEYRGLNERFIGATLSFKSKDVLTFQCNSETIEYAESGKEYINCMIPRKSFDMYTFIVNSPEDIQGQFRAVVGEQKVYKGIITSEGKALLREFHKAREKKDTQQWKNRSL